MDIVNILEEKKLKLVMKNMLALVIGLVCASTYAQSTGPIRANYVNAFIPSCVENQKTLPENKGITLQTINSYCKCTAQISANGLTNQQIEMLDKLNIKEIQQKVFLQSAMKKATEYCQVNYSKY
jgi:hypothetical protein